MPPEPSNTNSLLSRKPRADQARLLLRRLPVVAAAVVLLVPVVLYVEPRLPPGKRAAVAVGSAVLDALVADSPPTWRMHLAPAARSWEPGPSAMDALLHRMQPGFAGCRGVPYRATVSQALYAVTEATYRARFARACIAVGPAGSCATVTLILRRNGGRWGVYAAEWGAEAAPGEETCRDYAPFP